MNLFRKGMEKTRAGFFGRLAQALGSTDITEETWDDLETLLVQADVGVKTTELLIKRLRERYRKEGLTHPDQLSKALRTEMRALLKPPAPLNVSGRPLSVILIVGVNGSGKTTTIGKLANRFKNNGRKVIVAAGDTFRAAAIEQLQQWGKRADVEVVAGQQGGDPAAISFQAVQAAQARGADILIIDTAGRLQNKSNLMEELRKIKRVIGKAQADAPHEVLLVIDGNTGQNALAQVKAFDETLGLTGLVITKLDGTAKGGVLAAIALWARERKGPTGATAGAVPVYFIGVGEKLEDLQTFDAREFASALLG
jgi:fused signal recognition particle receptor